MSTWSGDAGREEQPEELPTKELDADAAEVPEVLDVCPGFVSLDTLLLEEWPPWFASLDTELRELWKVSFELWWCWCWCWWWWWWWDSFEL